MKKSYLNIRSILIIDGIIFFICLLGFYQVVEKNSLPFKVTSQNSQLIISDINSDFEVFQQYVDQYIKCPINFILSEGRNSCGPNPV